MITGPSMPTCRPVVTGMPGSAGAAAGRWRISGGKSRKSPVPARLPAACVSRSAKVNRLQQVRFAGNWYSVPPRYVGQVVTVRVYVFRVEIAWQDQEITSQSRSYGREEEVLDLHHLVERLVELEPMVRVLVKQQFPETIGALEFMPAVSQYQRAYE